MNKLRITISALTLIVALFSLSSSAFAIGAAPLRVQIQAAPGESIEAVVRAQNTEDENKLVTLTKGDFYVRENEALQFMYEYDENNKYSMQNWIEFIENDVPIDANDAIEIKYKINIPEDAQTGGYYGVVFVGAKNPGTQSSSGVAVQTVVAQLVLLEVIGGLKTDVEIQDLKINEEDQIETIVFNKGNTHDSTSGKILITDRKLNILEEFKINEGQSNSLPDRQKTFVNQWDRSEYEPGLYYAYLDAETEQADSIDAELKFEIKKDGTLENLKLTKGKSYEIAKNMFNDSPIIPIVIIGFELLVALLYGISRLFNRKPRPTKKPKTPKKGRRKKGRKKMLSLLAVLAISCIFSGSVLAQDATTIAVSMTVSGPCDWSGDPFISTLTVHDGDVCEINNPSAGPATGVTIESNSVQGLGGGTLLVGNLSETLFQIAGNITNGGTIEIGDSVTPASQTWNSTLQTTASAYTIFAQGDATVPGNITTIAGGSGTNTLLSGGNLYVGAPANRFGQVDLNDDSTTNTVSTDLYVYGTLNNAAGTLTVGDYTYVREISSVDGVFTNDGIFNTVRFEIGYEVFNGGITTNNGTFNVSDYFYISSTGRDGTFNNTGILNLDRAVISAYIYTGGILNNSAAGDIISDGAVHVGTGSINGGTINNSGDCSLNQASGYGLTVYTGGTFNNSTAGNLDVASDMQVYQGDFTNEAGATDMDVVGEIKVYGESGDEGNFTNLVDGGTITAGTILVDAYGNLNNTGDASNTAYINSLGDVTIGTNGEYFANAYSNNNLDANLILNAGLYDATASTAVTDVAFTTQVYETAAVDGQVTNDGIFTTADVDVGFGLTSDGGIITNNATGTFNVSDEFYMGTASYDGTFNNYNNLNLNGAFTFDAQTQAAFIFGNAILNNYSTGTIAAPSGAINVGYTVAPNDITGGTINNDGTIDLNYTAEPPLELWGGAVNNNSGATLTSDVELWVMTGGVLTNNGALTTDTMDVSGTVTAPNELTVTNKLYVYDGGTASFTDAVDAYTVGSLEMQAPTAAAGNATMTIGAGATTNITGGHSACQNGAGSCSVEIGADDNAGADYSQLTVNGTLAIPASANDYLVEIGGDGTGGQTGDGRLIVGEGGTLDSNEDNITIEIMTIEANGLFEIDGHADLEHRLYIDGEFNVDTDDTAGGASDNEVHLQNRLYLSSTGIADQGMESEVWVDGSTTDIYGDYQLDGTLHSGHCTIYSGGLLHPAGDDESATATNFYLDADNLDVQSGGSIGADEFSTVARGGTGGGSHGGEGVDSGGVPTATSGATKATSPLYGQVGQNGILSSANGGGGMNIYADGNVTINGTITANGEAGGAVGGAGGTIILTQDLDPIVDTDAFFIGSGSITADGGDGTYPGGGGRIVIDSPLIDDPDFGSYDMGEDGGTIHANGGDDGASAYAATGTIVYLGDRHNTNGTLIIDQGGNAPTSNSQTDLFDTPTFDRTEVDNSANAVLTGITTAVCYKLNSSITDITCNTTTSLPDKPDSLNIQTTWVGTINGGKTADEPGYKTNGVSDIIYPIGDIGPVFAMYFRNPGDLTAEHQYVEIQVADNAAFSNAGGAGNIILWDATSSGTGVVDLGAINVVKDGDWTRDIEFNEDDNATANLVKGTPYFVRARFRNKPNTASGLWTHGDYNSQYKFTPTSYGQISVDCNDGLNGMKLTKEGTVPGTDMSPTLGSRHGYGTCDVHVSTSDTVWSIDYSMASGETDFDNGLGYAFSQTTDCAIPTDGTGTEAESGYQIITSTTNTDNTLLDTNIEEDLQCATPCSADYKYNAAACYFDFELLGTKDTLFDTATAGHSTGSMNDGMFQIEGHANATWDLSAGDYSLSTTVTLNTTP